MAPCHRGGVAETMVAETSLTAAARTKVETASFVPPRSGSGLSRPLNSLCCMDGLRSQMDRLPVRHHHGAFLAPYHDGGRHE